MKTLQESVRSNTLLIRGTIFILLVAGYAAVEPSPGLQASSPESVRDELSLSVTMITGEHSRDSNSTATTLTVTGGALTYEQIYHGARSNRHPPVKKEFKLTGEDKAALIAALNERHLIIDKTIAASTEAGNVSRYFELVIRSKLNGKEHSISITGPRNDIKLKENQTYRNSIYLIELLYKIINRTDPDIAMPELID